MVAYLEAELIVEGFAHQLRIARARAVTHRVRAMHFKRAGNSVSLCPQQPGAITGAVSDGRKLL